MRQLINSRQKFENAEAFNLPHFITANSVPTLISQFKNLIEKEEYLKSCIKYIFKKL